MTNFGRNGEANRSRVAAQIRRGLASREITLRRAEIFALPSWASFPLVEISLEPLFQIH
jgi:hypothetical protein